MEEGDLGRLTEGVRGMYHQEWNGADRDPCVHPRLSPRHQSAHPRRRVRAAQGRGPCARQRRSGVETVELVGPDSAFHINHSALRRYTDTSLNDGAELEAWSRTEDCSCTRWMGRPGPARVERRWCWTPRNRSIPRGRLILPWPGVMPRNRDFASMPSRGRASPAGRVRPRSERPRAGRSVPQLARCRIDGAAGAAALGHPGDRLGRAAARSAAGQDGQDRCRLGEMTLEVREARVQLAQASDAVRELLSLVVDDRGQGGGRVRAMARGGTSPPSRPRGRAGGPFDGGR